MKRITLFITALIMTAVAATAQQRVVTVAAQPFKTVAATKHTAKKAAKKAPVKVEGLSNMQRILGYTLTDEITTSGAYFGTAGTYRLGVFLSAAALSGYEGCKVVGIRFAISQSIGSSNIFLAAATDDGSITETYATQSVRHTYEGWQNVWFNAANEYTIKEGENLVFGFDYNETADMVTAEEGALCAYGENETSGAFVFVNNNELYDVTGVGYLCAQLIVDISNMPAKDLSIEFFDSGFRYKKQDETFEAYARILNIGRNDISNFQLGWQIDNTHQGIIDINKPVAAGTDTTYQGNLLAISDLPVGRHNLKFFIKSIEGEAAQNTKNDTITTSFCSYADAYARQKMLLEVYNHEASPYAYYINPVINDFANGSFKDIVTVVNIHAQETTLAVEGAETIENLYAYTYPSFTINRSYFPGEAYIAYDMNDFATVLPAEWLVGFLEDMVGQDYGNPSFALVDLDASYNIDTRQLTATAKGVIAPDAEAMFGKLAVTIMLTEDNVKSRQVVVNARGSSSWNNNYIHNHVLRQYLTAPTGNLITPDGSNFSTTVSTTLNEAWDPEQMHLVAIITRATDNIAQEDLLGMDITQANSIDLAEIVAAAGIKTLSTTAASDAPVYTLDGRKVAPSRSALSGSQLPKGIYISNGQKFVVK